MRTDLKTIEELKEVPYPHCFQKCAVAQMSENAFASCEVHCLHKLYKQHNLIGRDYEKRIIERSSNA